MHDGLRRNQPHSSSLVYEVEMSKVNEIGWKVVFIFSFLSIGAFSAHQYGPIVVFVFFIFMGIYFLLNAGKIVLDQYGITHRNYFGKFRLHWSEITKIEVAISDGTMVFYGENKRLVLTSPAMWSGQHKFAAHEFLVSQLKSYSIKPCKKNTAAYRMHKNVRVRDGRV